MGSLHCYIRHDKIKKFANKTLKRRRPKPKSKWIFGSYIPIQKCLISRSNNDFSSWYQPEWATRKVKQNAYHLRTWNLFGCLAACWQPFHTCCGSQSGEDAFQLPEAEAQVACLTWISCLSAPFSNRWMDRQPLNHNTQQDGISGFVSGNYISLQIGEP